MISKFTADSFSKDGIYESASSHPQSSCPPKLTACTLTAWINIRNYPFLNNKVDYRNDTVIAKDVATSVKDIVFLTDEGWTFSRIGPLVRSIES